MGRVKLTKVRLINVRLTKVRLTKVRLIKVRLTKVRLTNVRLTKVRLTKVRLIKVRLTKVWLTKVRLTKVRVSKVRWRVLCLALQPLRSTVEKIPHTSWGQLLPPKTARLQAKRPFCWSGYVLFASLYRYSNRVGGKRWDGGMFEVDPWKQSRPSKSTDLNNQPSESAHPNSRPSAVVKNGSSSMLKRSSSFEGLFKSPLSPCWYLFGSILKRRTSGF